MGILRKHSRGIIRTVGIVLLLFGLFAAYFRYYLLGPWHHAIDPRWITTHSQQRCWEEVQKSIKRSGRLAHEHGSVVGHCGDKSWAKYIMDRLKPDSEMGCFSGHTDTAMDFITNQGFDDDAQAWLSWWKTNKDKSQTEWIRDGFVKYGIKLEIPRAHDPTEKEYGLFNENRIARVPCVENPPSREQTESLLILLGVVHEDDADEPDNKEAKVDIPSHIRYNAFRWLRDTGFSPVDFLLANKSVSVPVERGLCRYAADERCWPVYRGVGILPFGEKQNETWSESDLPTMLRTEFQVIWAMAVLVPQGMGAGLIAWSFRRRRHSNTNGGL